jgi:adenine phosphoribosyltransferase
MDLSRFIRDIPGFPKPGILFKDITPLLKDPAALRTAADVMAAPFASRSVRRVAALEARGFLFGTLVAERLAAGFIPIRKPGKLPFRTTSLEYALEYGTDRIEMHEDALEPGESVLIVDDVLATGGTAAAAVALVERAGGKVVGLSFLIELAFLHGRERIAGHDARAILRYD